MQALAHVSYVSICLCLVGLLWVMLLTQEGVFVSVIATLCWLQPCCHISATCFVLSISVNGRLTDSFKCRLLFFFFWSILKTITILSITIQKTSIKLVFFKCWNTVLIWIIWAEVTAHSVTFFSSLKLAMSLYKVQEIWQLCAMFCLFVQPIHPLHWDYITTCLAQFKTVIICNYVL